MGNDNVKKITTITGLVGLIVLLLGVYAGLVRSLVLAQITQDQTIQNSVEIDKLKMRVADSEKRIEVICSKLDAIQEAQREQGRKLDKILEKVK